MNSSHGVIFYFFIVFASSSIYCVPGLYEAVYYTEVIDRYFAFPEVKYDDLNNHYVVKTLNKNKDVYVVCPRRGQLNPSLLEIRKRVPGEAAVTRQCELPAEPRIYLSKKPQVYNAIGFLVDYDYQSWSHYSVYESVPSQYYAVIGLIYFKFDWIYDRIAVLRYNIVGGQFLKPKAYDNIWMYEKNEDVYGYDIDPLYYKSECPFVKTPLAPSEDFLFSSWKIAARQNIFTAPMLPNLHSQWKALEVFIRKVSQVIDVITVTTGVFGHLLKLPALYESENSSLKYFYLQNIKLRAPEYFWKTVTLQFFLNNREYIYGILFIIHQARNSDLDTKMSIKKFCPEYDIVKLGWTFAKDNDNYAPMYGCPLDDNIMELFGEKIEGKFEEFNLNSMSLLKFDDDGDRIVKDVNVVEELEKL